MAELGLKDYENLILQSMDQLEQQDVESRTNSIMQKSKEDNKSFLNTFYESLVSKTAEATKSKMPKERVQKIVPDPAVIDEFMAAGENMTAAYQDALMSGLEDTYKMREDQGIIRSLGAGAGLSPVGELPLPKSMEEAITPPTVETKELEPESTKTKPRSIMSPPLTDDDMGLPDNRSDEEKIIALEPMFKFISKGEGGYNASNRGTIKGKGIQGGTNNTTRDGKKLTEMTIAEIKAKQSITDPNNKDRLFAVGRFQTIPTTLDMAIDALNLSDDTVFNEATQDKIGRYLITQKREEVGKYLSGDTSISKDVAMQLLAQEFASFPVPKDQTIKRNGKTVNLKKGDSYYGSGNKAQHTFKEVEEELDKLRGNM